MSIDLIFRSANKNPFQIFRVNRFLFRGGGREGGGGGST